MPEPPAPKKGNWWRENWIILAALGAGLVAVAIWLSAGCAVNFGSGTASADASETKVVEGTTNRMVDVSVGK
jgi:hypothetical protein